MKNWLKSCSFNYFGIVAKNELNISILATFLYIFYFCNPNNKLEINKILIFNALLLGAFTQSTHEIFGRKTNMTPESSL